MGATVEIHSSAPDVWAVVVDGSVQAVYPTRDRAWEAAERIGPPTVVHGRSASMEIKAGA